MIVLTDYVNIGLLKELLKMNEEIKKTGVQEVVVIVVYQPVYHTESWEGRLYIDLDYLQTGEFGFELDDEYIERIKKQVLLKVVYHALM